MSDKPKPTPRFTVITLGVSDISASIAFYEALGFVRKLRATGTPRSKLVNEDRTESLIAPSVSLWFATSITFE